MTAAALWCLCALGVAHADSTDQKSAYARWLTDGGASFGIELGSARSGGVDIEASVDATPSRLSSEESAGATLVEVPFALTMSPASAASTDLGYLVRSGARGTRGKWRQGPHAPPPP